MEGYDFVIVGQGLAGSALAVFLRRRGKRLLVLDDLTRQGSSMVAAGLYNPVTGRKMVKTWLADRLFPFLRTYYREMEMVTNTSFLQEIPIYRPFLSVEEQNDWMGRSGDTEFGSFIKKIHSKPSYRGIKDPYGGILLAQSGFLDVPAYLMAVRKWLVTQGCFRDEGVDPASLVIDDGSILINGIQASCVVFCDGPAVTENVLFDWLPFRPVKGELLRIRMEVSWPVIPNRGLFLVPAGNSEWVAGSTYDHYDLSWKGTDNGKKKIEENLKSLVDINYEITAHYAGVRPATADRRPIMGRHPGHNSLAIFNGLGTKGVSLAPYWADRLAECLVRQTEVAREVNINRYFSLY